MKKFKIYFVAMIGLAIGFIASWLIFKSTPPTTAESNNHSIVESEQSQNQIYTCSMHPQIRQNEPGECPLCGMDLIPADSGSSSTSEFGFQMTADAIKLANIQTSIIGQSEKEDASVLQLNGKIKADETKAASLVSHIPGRIEKLYVSFTGEDVNQGQKIATIYSPELITAQKELIEAQKIEDISPGLLEAAKNKLRYWKIGNQVIDDILKTRTVREYFDIYADYAGKVLRRRVSIGDYLSKGEVLFDVQNLNNLWAVFDVYESDLSKIKVGYQILFTTPSVPNRTFKSTITFIDPVLNAQTRVATIRGEVSNARATLKPEMFIAGKLNVSQKHSKISVPKTAVLWTGERSVVYLKRADMDIPTFEYREIELGPSTGAGYNVIDGLNIGDEVVTNGAFVIDASSQLSNHISMMNKNIKVKDAHHSIQLPDYTKTTPPVFKAQLSAVATTYLQLKDALVASDSKTAKTQAEQIQKTIDKVDMSLLTGEAHVYWMEQLKALQSHGTKITQLDDVEEQRKQFDFFSQSLIGSLKVFGVESDTFYVQFCPMAFDNRGAEWLSKNEQILNPYFGKKMLKCGTIQDVIDKNFSNASAPHQTKTN